MSQKLPGPVGDEDLNDLSSPLALLKTRRSSLVKNMASQSDPDPGAEPSRDEIDQLLEIAVRVPDHGKLAPWRFIVFAGEARKSAGDILATRWRELYPDHGSETIEQQRQTFLQTPFVIAVVSAVVDSPKIPTWEQELSAGALCQNLLHGAIAMGFGAQWISGWCAFDRQVLEKFGVGADEKLAGFIYIGAGGQALSDRPRPDAKALTTYWGE